MKTPLLPTFQNTQLMDSSRKLLIVPGECQSLGGTLISLANLIQGFSIADRLANLNVLVRKGSLMERYLTATQLESCLQLIVADNDRTFMTNALHWVNQQPIGYPLLLDNCVSRIILPTLGKAAIRLRMSRRMIYHFCHDLARSYNPLGFLTRKLIFTVLAPKGIANSRFTANEVSSFIPNIKNVLYQPVDTARFFPSKVSPPPDNLKPALESGAKIIINASRITSAGIINDKNLRTLVHVLAHLRSQNQNYHLVLIGEDDTPNLVEIRRLESLAKQLGVEKWLTILPPVFEIEQYYQHADVLMTLAPREPFGRIVIEAIAAGLPVIGSSTGGIGEILGHFAPEWCVNPDDPRAAANAVLTVLNQPKTLDLIIQGQAWIKQHCSVENYAQSLMKITGVTK
jgi:glycosyltransferase involved in cell wall biosynthesis